VAKTFSTKDLKCGLCQLSNSRSHSRTTRHQKKNNIKKISLSHSFNHRVFQKFATYYIPKHFCLGKTLFLITDTCVYKNMTVIKREKSSYFSRVFQIMHSKNRSRRITTNRLIIKTGNRVLYRSTFKNPKNLTMFKRGSIIQRMSALPCLAFQTRLFLLLSKKYKKVTTLNTHYSSTLPFGSPQLTVRLLPFFPFGIGFEKTSASSSSSPKTLSPLEWRL